MKANIRHEIASLAYMADERVELPLLAWAAVAAHHGKLGRRHERRWMDPLHTVFWENFVKAANTFRASDPHSFDAALAKRYEYDGPRAWLRLADGRASAEESGDVLPDLKPFAYNFPYRKKRGVQEIISRLWDDPFAILRAPTGAGKTDASLLWAQHQIENGRADRLIIAMPTRFTSNALSVNVAKNLSQHGLYHSTAKFYERERQRNNEGVFDEDFFAKEMVLARLLETPVTVTTIDHLCIALTGASEDHHGIFWGLAHSCLVIDEADFYDDFTQRNMIVLLRALRLLDVPVLVMSATVPQSARAMYSLSGFSPKQIYEDTSDIERKRCHVYRKGRVQSPDDIEELLWLAEDGPLIIYANTVERAQSYRKWFADNGFADEKVVLYHSRFCEPDKYTIEAKLEELMGRSAWVEERACGVAILTQIGELSVNISADVMISDMCPIDRLAQRAGRLSRFYAPDENFIGDLYVVLPLKSGQEAEGDWYPAPYGTFASGKWVLSDALRQSELWLTEGQYAPRDFSYLVNALYPQPDESTAKAQDNARQLENSFIGNWLLVQNAQIENEDDEQTHVWKSRDIALQSTVYVNVFLPTLIDADTPLLDCANRMKFREWQLKHGVQIYGYQIAAAENRGAVEKRIVFVGEEQEKIWVVAAEYYDLKYGLYLNREDSGYDDFDE